MGQVLGLLGQLGGVLVLLGRVLGLLGLLGQVPGLLGGVLVLLGLLGGFLGLLGGVLGLLGGVYWFTTGSPGGTSLVLGRDLCPRLEQEVDARGPGALDGPHEGRGPVEGGGVQGRPRLHQQPQDFLVAAVRRVVQRRPEELVHRPHVRPEERETVTEAALHRPACRGRLTMLQDLHYTVRSAGGASPCYRTCTTPSALQGAPHHHHCLKSFIT